MRPTFKLSMTVVLGLLAVAASARAQATATGFAASPSAETGAQNSGGPYGLEKAANEFGVWGGGSFSGPTLIGSTPDTRLGLVAFRYARVLARGDSVALRYTIDAVPVATLSFPVFEASGTGVREVRRRITGAGLAPVGFQVNFRRRERVQPFAQTSGGFLYFGEQIPTQQGAQFNFTADFGGGVQWKTAARRAWTIGYRYHHVSNGYRADVNPGFDSNLFYVGFSIFR
ncbi:MAG TPA: acyloxyacyl hydrolase [Pyrinomonadaceae bacterium]|nr:acyloxyacyl hydrolase [Pyrinomonadaceae bacterium]